MTAAPVGKLFFWSSEEELFIVMGTGIPTALMEPSSNGTEVRSLTVICE